jgi:hypothetical protein
MHERRSYPSKSERDAKASGGVQSGSKMAAGFFEVLPEAEKASLIH